MGGSNLPARRGGWNLRKESFMKLKDVMTPQVEVAPPQANLTEVAQKMKNLDVGIIPVCDGQKLRGMISDRDIVIRAIAEKRDPERTRAEDIMSPHVLYCFEDQEISDAAEIMEQKQVRRLLVLNREKKLVGIVSLGDLAVKTREERLSGEILERISEPAHPAMAGKQVRM
jgi:CBS domain-containing protein